MAKMKDGIIQRGKGYSYVVRERDAATGQDQGSLGERIPNAESGTRGPRRCQAREPPRYVRRAEGPDPLERVC
jgi:hypothetical protein